MSICVKTPKGLEELTNRSSKLPQKAWRLLRLVDGSRDFDSIAKIFPPADNVLSELDRLLADGYITQRIAEPQPKPTKPATAATPANDLPSMDRNQRYEMARNFMLNTISAFLGVLGSSLIEKLEATTCLEHLQELYPAWRDALRLTSEGQKRAAELETRLASLLS
jgi:hypothetical protein